MSAVRARAIRSPRVNSASVGPPRSISRSIDAASTEPLSVSSERHVASCDTVKACPAASATRAHSPISPVTNASPPVVCTMIPMFARSVQVAPASAAQNTNLFHIACIDVVGEHDVDA
jgi:hypothetical protein